MLIGARHVARGDPDRSSGQPNTPPCERRGGGEGVRVRELEREGVCVRELEGEGMCVRELEGRLRELKREKWAEKEDQE